LLAPILCDERLTNGLDDAEARMLVEWLVAQVDEGNTQKIGPMCRRARAIARFVTLWCYACSPAAALQLAATERFAWPLPTDVIDPCDLLEGILTWETRWRQRRRIE
jgi:hypothetical protein